MESISARSGDTLERLDGTGPSQVECALSASGDLVAQSRDKTRTYVAQTLTIVRWLVGSLLVIAACLKMRSALQDLFYFYDSFQTSELARLIVLGLAVPLIEILVGLAILSAARPGRWQWILAGGTFVILLSIALAAYWSGESDCACFGRVAVRPLQTVILDAIVLAVCLLGVACASERSLPTIGQFASLARFSLLVWLGIVVATLGMEALAGRGLALHRDLVVRNYPAPVRAKPMEWFPAALHVRNTSNHEVTVFGGSQSCGTRFEETFPITLRGGESRLLRFQARSRERASVITIPMWLYVGSRAGEMQHIAYRARSRQ